MKKIKMTYLWAMTAFVPLAMIAFGKLLLGAVGIDGSTGWDHIIMFAAGVFFAGLLLVAIIETFQEL